MEKLDAFTTAYIEAILFSENDESTPSGGEPLNKNYSAEDIAPEAMVKIKEDCEKFQKDNASILDPLPQKEIRRAGHDFWLTRNHHGAGFWDGDWPEHGEALTASARQYIQLDIYLHEGKIYF